MVLQQDAGIPSPGWCLSSKVEQDSTEEGEEAAAEAASGADIVSATSPVDDGHLIQYSTVQ